MNLRTPIIYMVLLTALFLPLAAEAQVRISPAPQDQRLADENLAWEFYRNQDWANAKVLFLKLFEQTRSQHYFNQYLNCLIQLAQYDEAERAIRQQMRQSRDVQLQVDMGYIAMMRGDRKRAQETFDKLIREMPADRNAVYSLTNAFRVRGLNDQALQAYERAANMPNLNEQFLIERASLYYLNGNFAASTGMYLDYLDRFPEQSEIIKRNLQNMLFMDIDNSMAELIRNELLLRVQRPGAKAVFNEMLVWFSLQQREFDIAMVQAIALDRRFGDRESLVLELATISLGNEAYETALQGYNYITGKGPRGVYYLNGLEGSIRSRYMIAEQQGTQDKAVYQSIVADADKMLAQSGFNRETLQLAIIRAKALAYHMGRADQAAESLENLKQLVLRPEETASIKLELADIYLFSEEVWEATLLYSQVEKAMRNEPIAHEARFRNARLRYYIGEFEWALTQLDILKAATSKLIANDAMELSLLIRENLEEDSTGAQLRALARADFLIYRKQRRQALTVMDSLLASRPNPVLLPQLMLRKASLLADEGMQQEALALYKRIVTDFPDHYLADDALFRSAMLTEQLPDGTQEARKLYETLFNNYPASVFASQARMRYRLLRGDGIS
ncbi:MAG: tetratricopeptide repeat protein [Bacteroidetes bacterium]|nr:tetratricopeptide repeat protein [Bacteroidota bacterium]